MSESRFDFVALRRILLLTSLPLVAIVLAGLAGAGSSRPADATLRDLRTFSEVLQLTSRNYVDELELKQLERGAYQGLAETLDPWSSFYDPARIAELSAQGTSADVGLLLLKHPQQYVRIVVVVPGSPADEAGIRRGQYIETIDGRATKDVPLAEAEAMLRGAPGTTVKLGFFRQNDDEERGKVVDLARRDLSSLRVVERNVEAGTAVLRLTDLRPGIAALVAARLTALREAGVRDLVLDLRDNVGGSPDEAVAVADLLAPQGSAFQRVTRAGATTAATKDAATWDGGLVVLVSRATVGEAELLAETLRTLRGARLVGQPTLGKTTQQDIVRLSSGLGLAMSVAEYRRPDGTAFDADGLEPDEKVARHAGAPEAASSESAEDAGPVEDIESDEADAPPVQPGAAPGPGPGSDDDAQLKRALELLKAPAVAEPAPAVAAPARKAA